MHVHLLRHCSLFSKAQASTLNHVDNPKDKRDSPSDPAERADRRARARNVADLTTSAESSPTQHRRRLTVPKHILSLRNTARAMNPPNQNNIVKPSSAR